MQLNKTARIVAAVAAVILLGTAIFHATGYPHVQPAVARSNLSQRLAPILASLWLFFSWHLAVLAALAGWVVVRGNISARALLLFVAVVLAIDTVFVFSHTGIFPGTVLLTVATIALFAASLTWKKS